MIRNFVFTLTLILGLLTTAMPASLHADVLFDLVPMPGDFELTNFDHNGNLVRDGITANFTAHSDESLFAILGQLRFTQTGFGVDIVDATDQDPGLIDGGNSDTFGFVPERMVFSFDRAVRLDEITLGGLANGSTARLLNPSDLFDVYSDLTGSSNNLDTFDLSGANITLAPGQRIGLSFVNDGFSLQSLRVSAVPEPSGLSLIGLAALTFTMRRRRTV